MALRAPSSRQERPTRSLVRPATARPAVNSAAVAKPLPLYGKVENCGRYHIGGARTAFSVGPVAKRFPGLAGGYSCPKRVGKSQQV